MSDPSASASQRQQAMQDVSQQLVDRLVVPTYSRQQPFMFCGFVPGSSILTPWPRRPASCASSPPLLLCQVGISKQSALFDCCLEPCSSNTVEDLRKAKRSRKDAKERSIAAGLRQQAAGSAGSGLSCSADCSASLSIATNLLSASASRHLQRDETRPTMRSASRAHASASAGGRRSPAAASSSGAAKETEEDRPKYKDYKTWLADKHGKTGLNENMPLMQVKCFSLRSPGTNYLVPLSEAARQRQMQRLSQQRAISKTLFDAGQQTVGIVHDGDAHESNDIPEALLTWKGPKLVPELCSVHPLRLSVWRSLQYMPSVIYRLQVCFPLFSTVSSSLL